MKFVMRTTHPSSTNKFYLRKNVGGYIPTEGAGSAIYAKGARGRKASNRFCGCCGKYIDETKGSVMQNCKGYVIARWMESQSDVANGKIAKCKIPRGHAGTVYDNCKGIYDRGSTPRQGAIACWTNDGWGHVAFVEKVYDDGRVLISESHYDVGLSGEKHSGGIGEQSGYGYFGLAIGKPSSMRRGGKFQGYVYPPMTWDGEESDPAQDPDTPVSPSTKITPTYGYVAGSWITANKKLSDSEMKNNAVMAFYKLDGYDWSENAIYAILGYMQELSDLSPGRVHSDALGLVQWNPMTRYTIWALQNGHDNNSGDGQCEWLDKETTNSGLWVKTGSYDIEFDDFKIDKSHSVEWLATAFYRNFQFVALNQEAEKRIIANAKAWKDWFANNIITISKENSDDPEYEMTDDEVPDYSEVKNTSGEADLFKYIKPNNKHLFIIDDGWI